jgi:toxin ParE1/3/4
MPSSRKLVLSPEADEDIEQILQFTGDKWGIDAQEKYFARFERAFQRLLIFPESGLLRADAGRRVRCLVVGQHLIFYRVDEETISIKRLVHQQMGEIPFIED